MTNNEAAKWIQLYIDLAKIDPTTGEAAYLNDDNKKTIEAMEMAVNTLISEVCNADEPTCNQLATNLQPCKQDDLISRKAAIDAIRKWKRYETTDGLADRINNLPSAQPERKRGRWILQNHNKTNGMMSTAVYYYPKCSVCGQCANYTNFCPNCGADMRGEQDE